jgi:hypothetical protein
VKKTAAEVLVLRDSGKRTPSYMLRRALIESGVPYRCADCGLGDEWNGKVLILQVDHVNRNWRDDRACNLELRCPNCHTQTLGYAGSKAERVQRDIVCPVRWKTAKRRRYVRRKRRTKIEWPGEEELRVLIWSKPATHVARDIGVTSTAIKKRCEVLGIDTPPRGYWAKKKSTSSSE